MVDTQERKDIRYLHVCYGSVCAINHRARLVHAEITCALASSSRGPPERRPAGWKPSVELALAGHGSALSRIARHVEHAVLATMFGVGCSPVAYRAQALLYTITID